VLGLTAKRQNSDAFDEESLAATAILERRINPRWRYSYGGSVELSQIEEDTRDTTNTLFGAPLRLNYDGTDDLLDPTSGRRLGLSLTPYIGTFSRNVTFGVAEAAGSSYLAVPDERLVFAGRFRIGSAIGERTSQIPANKRFYAGGGGSVRGYELESLGLLDADGDPLGGRSVLELGLESRIRVNEDIGIVPFLEGGNVFDDPVPNGSGTLRWAAGIGLRYFTLVGPLRFDIAVPLDERPSDDDYQIYISIGQAF
jgi:translocation and assembly module TamA